MAPITDEIVDKLKDTVHKLEARVHDLESQLGGNKPKTAINSGDGMRMILIGPPGAGAAEIS